MIIYNYNKRVKLFIPDGPAFPISTEIKIADIGMNKTWCKMQLLINNTVFVDILVDMKEKDEMLNKLQNTADDIMDIIITQSRFNTQYVKSIKIDEFGNYTKKDIYK